MNLRTKALAAIASICILSGCAAPELKETPIGLAGQGNFSSLLREIKGGTIRINDYLPLQDPEWLAWYNKRMSGKYETVPGVFLTPLCGATRGAQGATGVEVLDELLKLGASLNQPCSPGTSGTAMDFASGGLGVLPGKEEVFLFLSTKGARTGSGSTLTINDMPSLMARNGARLTEVSAEMKAKLAEYERRDREERAKKSQSGDILGKVATGVLVAGVTSQARISNEAKVNIVGAVATDLMTDGKSNATANLLKNQNSVSTPSGNSLQRGESANVNSSAQDQPWKQCGPTARCALGNGRDGFCSGPATGAAPCKEGCEITLGMFYHDTTLPKGTAYIPTTEKCLPGCTAVNSCN